MPHDHPGSSSTATEEPTVPGEPSASEDPAVPEDAGAPEDTAPPEDAGAPEDTAAPEDAAPPEDAGAPEDVRAPEQPGAPEDAATPEDPDSIPGAATTRAAGPSGRRRTSALLALGAVTVILGSFGIWATVHASSLRAQSAQQNTALTDPAATSAVRTQIDSAVQAIFSYRYTDTEATRQAAQRLLTGSAIRQYNSLFALVRRDAPAEKLVVTTTVTSSGVELLTGNRARVLIFVNQQDTRSGTSQTSYSGAMLAVTAIREAGRWKIENIDTFT